MAGTRPHRYVVALWFLFLGKGGADWMLESKDNQSGQLNDPTTMFPI